MVYRFNPFTNNLDDVGDGSPSTGDVLSLTGNDGTPVLPDGAGNINVIGTSQRAAAEGSTADGGGLFVTGDPGTFTLTGTWESFGGANTFLGVGAGNNTLNASLAIQNTAIGGNALHDITEANENIAVGYQAMANLQTGSKNVAVGPLALVTATNANRTTAIGDLTLTLATSSENNTVLGAEALTDLIDGSNNIVIGQGAGVSYTASESGNILIGSLGFPGEFNNIRLGNFYDGAPLTGFSTAFIGGQLCFAGGDKGFLCGGLNSGDYSGFINNSFCIGNQSDMSGNTQFCHGTNNQNINGGQSAIIACEQAVINNGVYALALGCVQSQMSGQNLVQMCGNSDSVLNGSNSVAIAGVALDGNGSFAFGSGTFVGNASFFIADGTAPTPSTLDATFFARFGNGCDLNLLTIDNAGAFNATGGTQTNTITQVSRIANSATVSASVTSASVTVPYSVGAYKEIVFNTLCTNIAASTPAPGWTAGSGAVAASSFLAPYNGMSLASPANGNSLVFSSSLNIDAGTYMVEYVVLTGTAAALIDLSVTLGGGSPTIIRSQFDAWQNFGPGSFVSLRDYFTCTAANQSLVLTWTANGKNPSSGNYIISLGDCLRVTQIG